MLRMLGRHRDHLSRKVCKATQADQVEWLDFPSGVRRVDKNGNVSWDREWQHLQFLPAGDPAVDAWKKTWPTRGTGPNWDAIGRLRYGSAQEWLLVEAKANSEELFSPCQAEDVDSVKLIQRTLDATKAALGASPNANWLKPYYQYCNRLSVLHVANTAGTPTRLLYIYFCGDKGDKSRTFPASEDEWLPELSKQADQIGLPAQHPLHQRTHKVFMDVQCGD